MTPNKTAAQKALDELYLDSMSSWTAENLTIIIRALRIMDGVEGYPVSSGSTWNKAVAHTIEHLKKIGSGE